MTAAAGVLALFPVGAALAADRHDNGSEGVQISVVIAPLQACVGACAGGGGVGTGGGAGGGAGALPATGGLFPLTSFWIAAALLAVGLAVVLWQRARVAVGGRGVAEARVETALRAGVTASTDAAATARADRSANDLAPDGDPGDLQCRRT